MKGKYILLLIAILFFAFCTSVYNIKERKIKYKNNRIVGFLTYKNLTGNSDFDYLARAIPEFIKGNIKIMNIMYINRDDIQINKKPAFLYSNKNKQTKTKKTTNTNTNNNKTTKSTNNMQNYFLLANLINTNELYTATTNTNIVQITNITKSNITITNKGKITNITMYITNIVISTQVVVQITTNTNLLAIINRISFITNYNPKLTNEYTLKHLKIITNEFGISEVELQKIGFIRAIEFDNNIYSCEYETNKNIMTYVSNKKADFLIGGMYYLTNTNKIAVKTIVYDSFRDKIRFTITNTYNIIGIANNSFRDISDSIRLHLQNCPYGNLIINTHPTNAMIYIDNKYIGRSPITLNYLPIGEHTIFISKEKCYPLSSTISINEGENNIDIPLEVIKYSGDIYVSSIPGGADVFLDFDYKGKTPLHIANIPEGKYRLKLQKRGYKDKHITIIITNNSRYDIDLAMQIEDNKFYTPEELSSLPYNIMKYSFYGGVFTGSLYFTSKFIADDYISKYNQTYNPDYATKYNNWRNTSLTFKNAMFACFGVSFVALWFYLFKEDIDLGMVSPWYNGKKSGITIHKVW